MVDAAAKDGSPVVLVGPLVHLEARERAHVVGIWVQDSRYGPQVKVTEARPLAPDDPQILVAYLRRVKHVGAKRAADLVTHFGVEGVFDSIDRDPPSAFAAVGLRHRRFDFRGWMVGAEIHHGCANLRSLRRMLVVAEL